MYTIDQNSTSISTVWEEFQDRARRRQQLAHFKAYRTTALWRSTALLHSSHAFQSVQLGFVWCCLELCVGLFRFVWWCGAMIQSQSTIRQQGKRSPNGRLVALLRGLLVDGAKTMSLCEPMWPIPTVPPTQKHWLDWTLESSDKKTSDQRVFSVFSVLSVFSVFGPAVGETQLLLFTKWDCGSLVWPGTWTSWTSLQSYKWDSNVTGMSILTYLLNHLNVSWHILHQINPIATVESNEKLKSRDVYGHLASMPQKSAGWIWPAASSLACETTGPVESIDKGTELHLETKFCRVCRACSNPCQQSQRKLNAACHTSHQSGTSS